MSQSAQSHLTLILDLSPKQWHLSSLEPDGQALSLLSFITQVLAFMNSHLALRHENTISVLGAFPRKRFLDTKNEDHGVCLLYSIGI
jgi:transcription initiation factor TFIIH subunit 3